MIKNSKIMDQNNIGYNFAFVFATVDAKGKVIKTYKNFPELNKLFFLPKESTTISPNKILLLARKGYLSKPSFNKKPAVNDRFGSFKID
jgi:hypothetical protein